MPHFANADANANANANAKRQRLLWVALLWPVALSVSTATAAAAAATEQRGFVVDGIAGGLLFQRCTAAGPAQTYLMLKDKSPDAVLTAGIGEVRRVMRESERPLFVEFKGDVAGTTVTARQFQRAIGHVASCEAAPAALPSSVQLFAEGAQPAWRLQSTASGARLEVVGKKAVQFKAVSLTAADAAKKTRSFSTKASEGSAAMRLELVEQACNDTGSETAYGAKLVAQWGDQRFEGCAARF
jgi:uncharacterized membrane protein